MSELSIWRRAVLFIVVFFGGFANLAMEIIAPRMLASIFGATTISWAVIISVTLVGISAGYTIGGRFSRHEAGKAIAIILTVNAVWLVGISWIVWELPARVTSAAVARLIATAVAAFFLPSTLFGMLPPLSISLLIGNRAESAAARVAGNVFALSTIGSVLGALAAAFYLIPWVGLSASLRWFSLLLILFSLFFWPGWSKSMSLLAAGFFVLMPQPSFAWSSNLELVEQTEGFYQTIRVYTDGASFIRFHLGPTYESEMDLRTGEPRFGYAQTMVSLVESPQRQRVLIIGGAGHAMARALENRGATVTEVEIDPIVARVSDETFGPIAGEVVIEDGRVYLERTEPGSFDTVLVDAFNGPASIPPQLTTREFFEAVERALTPNGVMLFNFIGRPEGEGSESYLALASTMAAAFAQVRASAVTGSANQNVVFVATSGDRDLPFQRPPADGPVLTDDLNPIEIYLERARKGLPFTR